ncbi:MAG: DMT family transporter [Candidatus Cloacimonetes bacterium]|nr:DMT family transporter [Candidatus Cloacimonadota bacterium]
MKLKSHLFTLLAIGIWSTLELTGKLLDACLDPFAITSLRFLIGGAFLAPVALWQMKQNKLKLGKSSLLAIGALGILNVVISMLLLQLAIYFGKASLTAMIVSMNPLFVSVFAVFILGEKLNPIHKYSLGVGVLGLIIIFLSEGELYSAKYHNLPLGITFAILAGLTFALYTVTAKRLIDKYGNFITNSFSFLFGGLCLAIINLVLGKPMLFEASMRNLLLMGNMGIMISGLAYLLYFEAMRGLGAANASIYFFIKPAFAAILAMLVLGERLGAWQIAGMLLIMLALSRNILLAVRKA